MSASNMKEKAMFAVSVALVIIVIHYGQKKFGTLPVVGEFLPGGN